ncbi:MAG: hypothetical protein JKY53_08920 [Flavobacteriales bacterium]|nr:hypothetical protein [Flavobacteriales bacterium]
MSSIQNLYEKERKLDLDSIIVGEVKIWAFIRNYIGSRLMFNQNRRVYLDKKLFFHIAKNLFYGSRALFVSQYEHVVFSSSDQRKKMGGKYVDRIDYLAEILPGKFLFIELPNPNHYSLSSIPTKYIISKYVIYLLEFLYGKFLYRKGVIENEQLLKDVLNEFSIDEDYNALIKKFFCQYGVMNWLIKRYGIKNMFIANAYTNMGYVLACKENGCRVVEFQHGIVNSTHYAYNVYKDYGRGLYPDYLFVFGNKEKEIFTEDNYLIKSEKVIPIGNFYIDYILQHDNPDQTKFRELTKPYKKTVAVAIQDAFEQQIIDFLREAASIDSTIGYVLMPRKQTHLYYTSFDLPENVIYCDFLNTYEIIKECDFHSTMTPTTAIESPSLGTRNVLMNIDNMAKEYYEKILQKPVTYFADTPVLMVKLINDSEFLSREEITLSNSDIIAKEYKENLTRAVKSIFND